MASNKIQNLKNGVTLAVKREDYEYIAGHSNVVVDDGEVKVISMRGDYSLGASPQVERVVFCDDAPEGHTVHYTVKTKGMANAQTLTEGELDEKSWAFKLHGLAGMHTKGNREKYANVIHHLAGRLQPEWAKYISGVHVDTLTKKPVAFYLTERKRLTNGAQPSRAYKLFDAVSDFQTSPEEMPDKAAIISALSDFRKITPDDQSIAILLMGFSSPLLFVKPEGKRQGFMGFCAGRGGSKKTGNANLARALIRPYEESGHDATFRTARSGLEPILKRKRHQPVLIDDLEEFDGDNKATLAQLLNINKSAYDGGALRNRSRRDLTQAASSVIAFNPIVTSEFIPEFNNAFWRRTLLIPFGNELGCQPIRATTSGQALGMEEYYKLQHTIRPIYDHLIMRILARFNAGQMAEASKWLAEETTNCAAEFGDVDEARPHYCIQAANSVMRIAGELIALAKLLDDICKTGKAWYKAAFESLDFIVDFQLKRMQANERAMTDVDLLDEVIYRYFEAIKDGRAKDRGAQHLTINTSSCERLIELQASISAAIYSHLDIPKNVFLLTTGGRELFCAIAQTVFRKQRFSEDDLWSYFEMNGLVLKRDVKQRSIAYYFSNGDGWKRGWCLKADKFIETLNPSDANQQ